MSSKRGAPAPAVVGSHFVKQVQYIQRGASVVEHSCAYSN